MENGTKDLKLNRKLRLYREKAQFEDKGKDFVVFKLRDEKYAVSIDFAQEILKPKEITDIPFTPDFMTGVVNLRGKIVPVVNLRMRFGLPEVEIGKTTRIVVVHHGDGDIGLMVDSVLAVQPIPDNMIETSPDIVEGTIDSDYFMGIANMDGEVVTILNLEKTLQKQTGAFHNLMGVRSQE